MSLRKLISRRSLRCHRGGPIKGNFDKWNPMRENNLKVNSLSPIYRIDWFYHLTPKQEMASRGDLESKLEDEMIAHKL